MNDLKYPVGSLKSSSRNNNPLSSCQGSNSKSDVQKPTKMLVLSLYQKRATTPGGFPTEKLWFPHLGFGITPSVPEPGKNC